MVNWYQSECNVPCDKFSSWYYSVNIVPLDIIDWLRMSPLVHVLQIMFNPCTLEKYSARITLVSLKSHYKLSCIKRTW